MSLILPQMMPMPWLFVFFLVYLVFFLFSMFIHLFFISHSIPSSAFLFFKFYSFSW